MARKNVQQAEVNTGEIALIMSGAETNDDAALMAQIEALEAGESVDVDLDTRVAEMLADAYSSQTSDLDVKDEDTVAAEIVDQPEVVAAEVVAAAAGSVPRTLTPRVAGGPDVEDDIEPFLTRHSASAGLVLDANEGALDADAVKALAGAITQKKVRAKAANLLSHIVGGRKVDTYTAQAMAVIAKAYLGGESVSKKQLFQVYKDKGYNDGTANAQSGQIMSLAPALRIASRAGAVLTPNSNSTILDFWASK